MYRYESMAYDLFHLSSGSANNSVIHKEPIRDLPDSNSHWCFISGMECTVSHAASTVDSGSLAWSKFECISFVSMDFNPIRGWDCGHYGSTFWNPDLFYLGRMCALH